ALRRRAQPLGRLGPPQVAGQVGLGPDPQLPARVVLRPRALVALVLTRQRPVTEPDLVEDPRDHAVKPPSTRSSWPVTYADASEARKSSAPTRSSGSAIRPSGTRAEYFW